LPRAHEIGGPLPDDTIMPNTLHRRVHIAAAALTALLAVTAAPAQSLVERGEYLVRAGDCIGCHTATGSTPLAGGLRIETPFGYMLSPNITPDVATGIGSWSNDDFYRAMHHGVNKRGEDMYPTMPFDFYTKVTRADVDAMYAYLRTVKPVTHPIETNHLHFPFDLRWSMAGWRELFFREGAYVPDPKRTPSWNRGAYLVEGLGHCSDCHSPRNLLGGIEKSKDFAGAVVDGWFALDLSSDIATGLGSWSVDEIATYLKTGTGKDKTTVLGPMALVISDSLKYLTDDDLKAMGEYLKSIPPDSPLRTGRVKPDATKVRGAQLYLANCSGCHQASGRGIPGVFPPLAGNGVVLASDPNDIVKVVDNGVPGRNQYVAMPAFKVQLTEDQVADIANYVRTSWGNRAAPNTTPQLVGKLRAGK
jgi:mono/diheme cytochrome c family protein